MIWRATVIVVTIVEYIIVSLVVVHLRVQPVVSKYRTGQSSRYLKYLEYITRTAEIQTCLMRVGFLWWCMH